MWSHNSRVKYAALGCVAGGATSSSIEARTRRGLPLTAHHGCYICLPSVGHTEVQCRLEGLFFELRVSSLDISNVGRCSNRICRRIGDRTWWKRSSAEKADDYQAHVFFNTSKGDCIAKLQLPYRRFCASLYGQHSSKSLLG
jgi:hypothetical protein